MMPAGSFSNLPLPPTEVINRHDVAVPWDRIEHFIGQFTHDVRNGLNALELQLTFLGEISTDPEAVEEVKRLRRTLLDVTRQLQAVKAVSGPVSPHILEYPESEFFEDLHERLERLHPEASGLIFWDVTGEPGATLRIDPDLTINGVLELFSNAFQFGGSSIVCTTAGDALGTSFILRETPVAAPSVPPENWGCEPLRTTRRGAYGLGLFRVRRILETQGGSLRIAYSESENLLTTVVTLPRVPLAGAC